MSERGAFFTVKETAELFSVCPRTVHRWIARGLITPRIQYRGGTCFRFIFPCSLVIEFLERLPTLRDLEHPAYPGKREVDQIRKLRELRRRHIRKATAARMAGKSSKARREIVDPGAD